MPANLRRATSLRDKFMRLGSVGRLAGCAALWCLPACQGSLLGDDAGATAGTSATHAGGGAGASTTGGAAPVPGPIAELDCEKRVIDPGPSPLQLLSREQYLNTVKELAGEVTGLEEALGDAVVQSAFGLVQPDVTQVQVEAFQKAADAIAASIANDVDALNRIAPCAADAAPADCARALVGKFGALAYRAPVTDPADIERHVLLFAAGASTSYEHGVELLLRGMLQSPRFLYRVELGTNEKVSELAVKLAPHELAARLSYSLWDAPPNDRLNQAAASGALATNEGVGEQIAWMLQDTRGQKLLNRFLERWLHIGSVDGLVKNPEHFPEFQAPSFKASLRGQAAKFFDDVLLRQGGTLSALFGSTTVFYNQDLAGFYGVTGGAEFQSLVKNDGTAAGILTLPAVLAVTGKPDESSPIYRGRFVREALLCQQLPAPPADIPPAPEVTAGVSTRERASQHQSNPACSGCHQLLDPIGFAFENYDTLGRYRTEDGGMPVDASGKLVSTRDIDGPFNGVVELGQKLASSAEVRECVTRQWFRYALNRFEQPSDGCSVKGVLDSFDAAGHSLGALPKAIVSTDAFLYRRPIAEVQP
jgi:hypothetical protein